MAYPSVSSPASCALRPPPTCTSVIDDDDDARDGVEQQVRERRPGVGPVPEQPEVHEGVGIPGLHAEEEDADHQAQSPAGPVTPDSPSPASPLRHEDLQGDHGDHERHDALDVELVAAVSLQPCSPACRAP